MLEIQLGDLQFEADLLNYAKSIKRTYVTALKRSVNFFSNNVIKISPYKTGQYIASHRISFNNVDDTIYNGGKINKGTAQKIAKEQQAKIKNLSFATLADIKTIWCSNNTPQAMPLEYGLYVPKESTNVSGGYSKKAPKGVYRISAQSTEDRVQEIINKAESEMKNG